MRFAQSFLTCVGICLIAASVLLNPSVAYAAAQDCQDGNCLACVKGINKYKDLCPRMGNDACSCGCNRQIVCKVF